MLSRENRTFLFLSWISAIAVPLVMSEEKRKLIQMIFRQIQNTLGVSGAGRKGDFAASRVFTSAIKIK